MEILEIIIKSLAAGVAAAGFGILFNVPQRTILPIVILGAAGGLIKFGTMHFEVGIVLASFLAAIVIGIISIQMAHFKNSPPLYMRQAEPSESGQVKPHLPLQRQAAPVETRACYFPFGLFDALYR